MTGVVANVNAGLGTLDAPNATLGANPAWTQICPLDRIPLASGVAALLPGGVQVAVFRTDGGDVLAVGNIDPVSGAAVLSRGIVGDADGVPVVASPVYKERFDLRTGACLDADVAVPVYPVRVADGVIHLGFSP